MKPREFQYLQRSKQPRARITSVCVCDCEGGTRAWGAECECMPERVVMLLFYDGGHSGLTLIALLLSHNRPGE